MYIGRHVYLYIGRYVYRVVYMRCVCAMHALGMHELGMYVSGMCRACRYVVCM